MPEGYDLSVEFEARFNPARGGLEFNVLQTSYHFEQPAEAGLRTAGAAQWCSQRVVQDNLPGVGPVDTVEIYTVDGTNLEDAACAPSDDPDTQFDYEMNGAFCSDIMVRSFYTTQLNDVHAEIYLFTPATGYSGMRWPLGTGAQPQPGLDNTYGLWSYGNLGPGDGHVGEPYGDPADEKVVKWVFHREGRADWYFRGRIVAKFAEVCTAPGSIAVDDDCDGRIDEGAGCYPDGDPCNSGIDCQSGICASGRCGTSSFQLQGVVGTGGGGTMEGNNRRMILRVGAPQPMGEATGGTYGIRLGPLSDR